MNARHLSVLAALAACTFAHFAANAAEVCSAEAREAVAGWAALGDALSGAERFGGREIADVATYEGADGNGAFHVVSFVGGGFAVTSGDTEVTPILAYSEEGEFAATEENPLWALLVQDVAGRAKQLEAADAATATKAKLLNAAARPFSQSASSWARLREAGASPKKTLLGAGASPAKKQKVSDLRVGPICKTWWSQSDEQKGRCYNYYTPSNVVCGCTATAFAQILRTFEWPKGEVSLGSRAYSGKFTETVAVESGQKVEKVTYWNVGGDYGDTWEFGGPAFGGVYDWANMPYKPSSVKESGTLTDAQRQEIGRLCRDCGITVGMSYKASGSAAPVSRVKLRLLDQFGYKNAVFLQGANMDTRLKALVGSFDLGSPCAIGIEAIGEGPYCREMNHAIVGDGYGYEDGRIYIHFNFGWGDSLDTAWYAPPLDDETNAHYPVINATVYNIYTPEMCDEANRTVVSGRITGEEDAPIEGVNITATDDSSGAAFTATTGETGIYALLLPPDRTYTIRAEKDGRRTATTRKVERTVTKTVNPNGTTSGTAIVKSLPFTDLSLAAEDSGDKWLDERAGTHLFTGSWAEGIAYGADGKAQICDNAFTPLSSSTGNVVTVEMTAQFIDVANDSVPDAGAQAAVRLRDGTFQVWAGEKLGVESGGVGELGWVDVEAEGVVPVSGAEYSLRTTFDYTANTYSVKVKCGDEWLPLNATPNSSTPNSSTPNSNFPLAVATNCVTSIGFIGDTLFTSLLGDCAVAATGFAENEEIALDGATNVLNAARALWLSGLGDKATVAAAAASLTADKFDAAYLLNFDFTAGEFTYTFEIKSIDVFDDRVEVAARLHRAGTTLGAVNGTLNFYGAATLESFKAGGELVGTATLTEDEFGEGETATATIQLEGETPPAFFNAKIE